MPTKTPKPRPKPAKKPAFTYRSSTCTTAVPPKPAEPTQIHTPSRGRPFPVR